VNPGGLRSRGATADRPAAAGLSYLTQADAAAAQRGDRSQRLWTA